MSYNSLVKKTEEAARSLVVKERIDPFSDVNMTMISKKLFIESRIDEYRNKCRNSGAVARANWMRMLLFHICTWHASKHCQISYRMNQEWMQAFLTYMTTYPHKRKITNTGILKHLQMLHLVLDYWNILYQWEIPGYLRGEMKQKQLQDEILSDEEVEMLWTLEKQLGQLPITETRGRPGPPRTINSINSTLDKFLISLYTGCRMDEVNTIFTSYDPKTETDLVGWYASKNKRAKFIPMHNRIRPLIERGWFKAERRATRFESIIKMIPLTGQGQIVVRLGNTIQRRVVSRKEIVHFHSARQTFTVRMIEAGMDIYELSKLLGHSSVQVTEKYYAFAREQHMIKRTVEVFTKIA